MSDILRQNSLEQSIYALKKLKDWKVKQVSYLVVIISERDMDKRRKREVERE
jgi:hypothetical protein